MSKSIFPTFEEIDNGTKSFSIHYYRTVNGKKVRSEKMTQYVLLADIDALRLIDSITIVRNKNKKRLYFEFTVFGKTKSLKKYPYTEQGWQLCIADLKKELQKYRKSIERIMNEGYTNEHSDD
jgi:hypothetical protein